MKQHKNYQDEDKKSAINKRLILRLRSLISKGFQLKTSTKKFGTDPTLEDQIRIYKTKKSILDCPSWPVVQRIEALSLCGSR